MKDDGSAWEIVSAPDAHPAVVEAVKKLGIEPDTAQIAMLPQNYIKLEGKQAQQMLKLMEALEDHDDTQQRLVELRRRGAGDRGLAGVRDLRDRSRVRPHRLRLRRHRRQPPPPRDVRRPLDARRAAASRPAPAHPRRPRAAARRPAGPTASSSKTCFTRGTCGARSCSATRAASPCSPPCRPACRSSSTRPAEIKLAVVGYGRAEKTQMQQMVKLLLRPRHGAVAARRRRRAGRRDLSRAHGRARSAQRRRRPRARLVICGAGVT